MTQCWASGTFAGAARASAPPSLASDDQKSDHVTTLLALLDISLRHAWPTVLTVVPIGLLAIAAINAWLAARTERRRTQPVVICHEQHTRAFAPRAGVWLAS